MTTQKLGSADRQRSTTNRSARATGLVMLLTAAAMLISFGFSDPGFEGGGKEEYAQRAAEVAAGATGIVAAQAVMISLAVLAALTGAGLYLHLRRSGLGLVGMLMLLLWGLFSAVQGLVGMAMVAAAQTYVEGGLVEAGADQSLELIHTLGAAHWASWLGAAVLFGLGLLAFGVASTRGTPRWLSAPGVVGGGLLALTPLVVVLDLYFFAWLLGAVLAFAWVLVTALRLIARPTSA